MGNDELEEGNIKLTVFKVFPYEELKKICDCICDLGYDCKFVDNGNIVFQMKKEMD
ncbi:hypothetical protein KAU11_07765 [Candidatus Babeliales bacterium]|nr:hypothetical protein [Candidatus Babeliales bacterium]